MAVNIIRWTGVAGCILGVFITMTLKFICMPSSHNHWPSYVENPQYYMENMWKDAGYTYRNGKDLYNLSLHGKKFEDEATFLRSHVQLLCYSVDIEMDDIKHIIVILQTWARYCDSMLLFYSNPEVIAQLNKSGTNLVDSVKLVFYVTGKNDTIKSLLEYTKPMLSGFDWVVYVPANVYLIPGNLRYYIQATAELNDHQRLTFLGKPHVAKLTGTWSLSDESPLVISRAAIVHAFKHLDSNCFHDNLSGRRGLVCLEYL